MSRIYSEENGMTYEEIWQKIKSMSQRNRKLLAYEMILKRLNVGYVHLTTTLTQRPCMKYCSIQLTASMKLMTRMERITMH